MARPRRRRTFGEIQERKGKQGTRFYPRFQLPGSTARFSAGVGFTTWSAANAWLDHEQKIWESHVANGTTAEWLPPTERAAAAKAEAERNATSVADMLTAWMDSRTGKFWEQTTRVTNEQQLRNRLLGVDSPAAVAFRSMPLSRVTRREVNAWWDELWQQFPTTRRTNQQARKHVTAAFKWATREEMIPTNPVDLEMPRQRTGEVREEKKAPTLEEIQAILEEVPEWWKFPTALALVHGLRTQEVLGLRRWQVKETEGGWIVDLSDRRRVRAAVRLVENGKTSMVDKGLKTDSSYRVVPVFDAFAEMLVDHLERFAEPGAEGLVAVTRGSNRPTDTSWTSVIRRAGEKAAEKIIARDGLEGDQAQAVRDRFAEIRKHDGRRFIATALYESGATDVAAGGFIGDRSNEVLRRHYLRSTDGNLSAGLDAVGKRLES